MFPEDFFHIGRAPVFRFDYVDPGRPHKQVVYLGRFQFFAFKSYVLLKFQLQVVEEIVFIREGVKFFNNMQFSLGSPVIA